MNCSRCQGSCCEFLDLPLVTISTLGPDVADWAVKHGSVAKTTYEDGETDFGLRLDCRCRELTDDGQCAVYESRPLMCRDFEVGGPGCIDAVRRQRAREQYEVIRDDGDPMTWEVYG